MIPILIPTWRQNGDWRDLVLAVTSLQLYAPEHPIFVGWRGPRGPSLYGPFVVERVVERPAECESSAQAVWWMREQFAPGDFILWTDDCVASPDTVQTLLNDVAELRLVVGERLGVIGCRSDWVSGPQNIRDSNGTPGVLEMCRFRSESNILETDFIAPIVAHFRAEHFEGLEPPTYEWFSDDWHTETLTARGYHHFISRAYVHHVGMRSALAAGISPIEMQAVGLAAREAKP